MSSNTPATLPPRLYDTLKLYATVILPAIGGLYIALGHIWGLPHINEVVATIAALNVTLGGVVKVSSDRYNNSDAKFDGTIDVEQHEDKKVFTMNLKNENPEDIADMDVVTFKVNPAVKVPIKKAPRKRAAKKPAAE